MARIVDAIIIYILEGGGLMYLSIARKTDSSQVGSSSNNWNHTEMYLCLVC